MPNFDDVTQPPHFRPQYEYPLIERCTVLLKDGETTATIYPIHSPEDLPPGLLAFLCDEFNMEIERGDTSPFFDTLHIETFQNYWFGSFAAVMVLGDAPNLALESNRQWEKECLGTFHVKPNYPGRCSHICTAGFLVNAGIRGKGIGTTLAECYLAWAPKLGYTYSVFNLVFETNAAARAIWEALNFKRIGRIKAAGILKGSDTPVDAIMYGRDIAPTTDANVGLFRFDKIKYYLETGRYPSLSDRQEKSRLRSSASHYHIEDGKLMLKDREVVSDPDRQLTICSETHMVNHGGINKTTSAIAERFHWTRIKDTVAQAIRQCPECRDPTKSSLPKPRPMMKPKLEPHGDVARTVAAVANQLLLHGAALKPASEAHDVDAMIHQMPARHEGLLPTDLAGLDPDDPSGIIAAVEAASRSQHQAPPYGQQYGLYQQDYSPQYNQYAEEHEGYPEREGEIPVDPQVSAFDAQEPNGAEIEIARALIQANEDANEMF
ncbi:hypothetical protein BABINDRAFT_8650 [Babjeviella inositovora NRRL Y-12698]|uniref:N-acetyltransferase domain-containing protein n=1 Tax=Babjeviella inositovora NRRL Y-12698 TaxID=984486 RepID=A0A1E3QMT7_9ASCO|nr:uncharacterized protein BABINDRAFT_8650 [Babjeviella inositovora NRRL Y-12698]ODQ79036.1 hypothetical protein BABINDRAFT_8650 [Babjeviella inositovora NRRL Y-12698]